MAELLRTRHNLIGYGGKWSDTQVGWGYMRATMKIAREGSPWYDLHAWLGD